MNLLREKRRWNFFLARDRYYGILTLLELASYQVVEAVIASYSAAFNGCQNSLQFLKAIPPPDTPTLCLICFEVLNMAPTPESAAFLAKKPTVPPTFDGVDYDDTNRLKQAQDAIIREQWVKSMMARLVREELGKCYYREGVNHLEKCGALRGQFWHQSWRPSIRRYTHLLSGYPVIFQSSVTNDASCRTIF